MQLLVNLMEQGKYPQLLLTSQKERQPLVFLEHRKKIETESDQTSASHYQFRGKPGDNAFTL